MLYRDCVAVDSVAVQCCALWCLFDAFALIGSLYVYCDFDLICCSLCSVGVMCCLYADFQNSLFDLLYIDYVI